MKHKLQFDKLANQILNENMNSESVPDVTKIVASVGAEATEGILNDLNGLDDSTLETLQGMIDAAGEEEIGASYTSFEEGANEVLDYYMQYNEENPEELEELKGLLQKLKQKANGKNVKWVTWGIETDVNLGFIAH